MDPTSRTVIAALRARGVREDVLESVVENAARTGRPVRTVLIDDQVVTEFEVAVLAVTGSVKIGNRSPAASHHAGMTIDQARQASGVTAVLDRPGARLVYEVAGDGPAVVLIHGFGLDLRMWDPQAAPLADR